MRRTKIVCTIGPITESEDMLIQLVEAGMNVARLNLSHGDYQEHGARVERLQRLRSEMGIPLAIMLDTKGPEIRTGLLAAPIDFVTGQQLIITTREVPGSSECISVSYTNLHEDVCPGMTILLDDGLIACEVQKVQGTDMICKVCNDGTLGSRKGVNIPGAVLQLPALTEKDIADIRFAVERKLDIIAMSFVRKASDVLEVRKILDECGGRDIQLIAKIENQQGVANLDDIITVSDGIMVARGDLGVELPTEQVPVVQKTIIRKCNQLGKPVITATQMLDSMIRYPRPTRAETSDVANSILDGTDAIMLSGETATGRYPIESVRTMNSIALQVEETLQQKFIQDQPGNRQHITTVTGGVSHACCDMAEDMGATAIVTATFSGNTARMVSKHRPACVIAATTVSEKAYHQMALVWGVTPFIIPQLSSTDEMIRHSIELLCSKGILQNGDIAIITAGVPMGMSGTTNLINVHIVGDVLIRAHGVGIQAAFGRVVVAQDAVQIDDFYEGDILVCAQTDNSMMPLIRKAAGLIVESDDLLGHSAVVGLALDIPVILGAKQACSILKSNMCVTMDAEHGYVYMGKTKAV